MMKTEKSKDLIRREDAVSTVIRWASGEGGDIIELIESLPSAEQVTGKLNNRDDSLLTDDTAECKEQKSKLDLISRVDAIEAVEQAIYNHDSAIMRITSLPSASVETDAYERGRQEALAELMEYTYGMLDMEKFGLQHKIKSMIADSKTEQTERREP